MESKGTKRLGSASPDADTSGKRIALHVEEGEQEGLSRYTAVHIDENESIEAFRKDAIWREMLIYKRRLEAADQKCRELERLRRVYESSFALIHQRWKLLDKDLGEMVKSLPKLDEEEDQKSSDDKGFKPRSNLLRVLIEQTSNSELQVHQLNADLDFRVAFTTQIAAKLLKHIQYCEEKSNEMASRLREGATSDNDFQDEVQRLYAEFENLRALYDETLSNERSIQTELLSVRDNLTISQQKSELLENEVEDLKLELTQCHRRLEREKSKVFKEHFPATADHQEQHPPASAQKEEVTGLQLNALTPEVKKILQEHDEMLEQLDVARGLADNRLKELEDSRVGYSRLQAEFDRLYSDLHSLPEHRLAELGPYRALKSKVDFYQADVDLQRKNVLDLTKELELLRAGQVSMQEKIQNEESSRRKVLEGEMRKLETDLTRIRNSRDQLQMMLDTEKIKSRNDEKVLEDLRLNVSVNRDFVRCLLEDVRRLRAKMAAYAGDKKQFADVLIATEMELMEFNDNAQALPLDQYKVKPLVESLRLRLEETERKEKILHQKLVNAGLQEAADGVESISDQLKDFERIKSDLQNYKAIFGETPEFNQEKLLQRLASKDEQIRDLELKLLYHQQTEEAALSEIESIAKAFTQLENQQSQQITIIREKDDHISRLLADKTKIEQKLMLLHKEKDVVSNKALALTRQAQKWEELEAKLEADTKSKEIALEAASKELARAKTLISVHERKAQEAFQIAEELSLRQEKTSSKYNEFMNILKQKDTSIENHRRQIQNAEEENIRLQNKVKHLNRRLQSNIFAFIAASDPTAAFNFNGITGTPESVKEQLESLKDWKKIAQCSVCEFRIKNHVILRCMHVFCKECLDIRVETRQRKCPQCGGMFGPNDIKQIYI